MSILSKLFGREHSGRSAQPEQTRLERAKTLYDQGQREAALQILSGELRENPKNAAAYVYRGGIYNRLQRYDESVADYTRALDIDPNNATTYYYRGNAYHLGGKSWEALADIEKSLQIDPSNARARENRRFLELYIQQNKISKPAPKAEELPTATPPPAQPQASFAAGEFLGALSTAERAAVSALEPALYQTVLSSKQGGYTGASFSGNFPPKLQAGLEALWKLDSADIRRLEEFASLTDRATDVAAQDIAEAARMYRKAIELNPYGDIAIRSYSIALYKQGEIDDAITWAKRAAQVNPSTENRDWLQGLKQRR